MEGDIILCLTNPFDSLAKLKTVSHTCGTVSGYKVNYNKSEVLPLSNFDYVEHQQRGPSPSRIPWSYAG